MINVKSIELKDFIIGKDKLTILAGPCAIESKEIMYLKLHTIRQTAVLLIRIEV